MLVRAGDLRIFVDLLGIGIGADSSWVKLTRLPLVLIINGRLLDWLAAMSRE